MSRPFLIVSPGRTATKWLAWVMNHSEKWIVEHEPKALSDDNYRGAVSPKHLLEIVRSQSVPICHRLGVIVRDPVSQAVSIQNRARVLGAACEKLYIENAKAYFKAMEDMILAHRATLISYDQMTRNNDYLETILLSFQIYDVKVTDEMLMTRKNELPIGRTELSDGMYDAMRKYAVPFFEKFCPYEKKGSVNA